MKALITALLLLTPAAYAGGDTQLEARLRSIVIPQLTITGQTVVAAVNIILEECSKTQTNSWCPGVIVNLTDGQTATPEPTTTMRAQNISVFTAFQQLATRNHLNCTIEDNAVVLTKKKIK
jgi:hypothetical protein